ncbi:MAG TPA: hypothetical protein VHO47_02645 [Candidatus Babeliales bacterium]|nr:hypothetical protein [Candidatus Babeliales bacterium]
MLKRHTIILFIMPFYLNSMDDKQLILGSQYYFTSGNLQGTIVTIEDTAERLMGSTFLLHIKNTSLNDPDGKPVKKEKSLRNVYFAKDENGQGYFIDSSMVEKK